VTVPSDGKRKRRSGRLSQLLRPVALTAALAVAAPHALAQDADIIGQLTSGVRCISFSAKEDLEFNIKKLGATGGDAISVALTAVAADPQRCEPLRQAAGELAAAYAIVLLPSPEDLAAEAVRAKVKESLAEADAKAANMTFEVGPPPRNMTKGRGEGS
jgi:hypothetical protein